MSWTLEAAITWAAAPPLAAAQPPTARPDSVRQGTATGRRVNQANGSGDTTRSALRDSLVRANSGAATETSGRTGGRGGSMNLARDQVRQLQEALHNAGCGAGTADGMMGRKARVANACARQKHGVAANDNQALHRPLEVNF